MPDPSHPHPLSNLAAISPAYSSFSDRFRCALMTSPSGVAPPFFVSPLPSAALTSSPSRQGWWWRGSSYPSSRGTLCRRPDTFGLRAEVAGTRVSRMAPPVMSLTRADLAWRLRLGAGSGEAWPFLRVSYFLELFGPACWVGGGRHEAAGVAVSARGRLSGSLFFVALIHKLPNLDTGVFPPAVL